MGKLNLPAGKKIAVNLGVDVDAQSLWLGGFNRPSPSFMSRGEFGTVVGIPRAGQTVQKIRRPQPSAMPCISSRTSGRYFAMESSKRDAFFLASPNSRPRRH